MREPYNSYTDTHKHSEVWHMTGFNAVALKHALTSYMSTFLQFIHYTKNCMCHYIEVKLFES